MESISTRLGKIAIVGGGKMGEAILSGLVSGAMFDPDSIVVAEPYDAARTRLAEEYGIKCVSDGSEAVDIDTLIIAVKPQVLKAVCGAIADGAGYVPKRVISIAAGITTTTLQEIFTGSAIIRVMPNAPLMVGAGMSAVCVAEGCARQEAELGRELFSLMGEAIILDESMLNVVTAISGSGPAYFALFVEALSAAGAKLGLSAEDSELLATQTLHGSARFLELTDLNATQLREAVTSPGGTTQAALECFEAEGLTQTVEKSVQAALVRAQELA